MASHEQTGAARRTAGHGNQVARVSEDVEVIVAEKEAISLFVSAIREVEVYPELGATVTCAISSGKQM